MKPEPKTKPMFVPIRSRKLLIPAAFALALSWSSVYLHADPATDLSQTLVAFQGEEGAKTAATTLTATADDLTRAVYQVVVNGGDPGATAAAALTASSLGKVRADFNTIAPRILNAAILAIGQRNNGTTTIQDSDVLSVLNAVLGVNSTQSNAKLKLNAAAVAAVTGEALLNAQSTGAGTAIATAGLNATFPGGVATQSTKTLQTFITSTLKSIGTSTGAVPSFMSQVLAQNPTLFSTPAATQTFATAVAIAEAKNPSAAASIITAAATGLDQSQGGAFQTFISSAVNNAKLATDVSAIVAQVGALLTTPASEGSFAAGLIQPKSKVVGSIISGALQAASTQALAASSTDPTSGESTSSIVSTILTQATTAGVTTSSVDPVLAGLIAAGNGATDPATGNNRAAEVANIFLTNAAHVTGSTPVKIQAAQTKIGESVLKAVAATSPTAAEQIGFNILTAENHAAALTAAQITALAGTLAKSTTVLSAAGSVVAGVIQGTTNAGVTVVNGQTNEFTISQAAIVADAKAAVNIAQAVSATFGGTQSTAALFGGAGNNISSSALTSINSYATQLASDAKAVNSAAAIAAGIAVTVGYAVDSNGENVVANIVGNMLNANSAKLATKAVSIATAVATAADYQEASAVGTKVAGYLASSPTLLASEVALATGLAKAVVAKTNVSYDARTVELGEIAAAIVSQAIGQTGKGVIANDAASQAKFIAAIGSAVIKTLSTKLYPNVSGVAKIPTDYSDAVQFIVGSIAQTIAVSTNSNVQNLITTLLGSSGALEKALATAVGKNYAQSVPGIFTEVLNAYNNNADHIVQGSLPIGTNGAISNGSLSTGKYATGSVVGPESPVVSI